jgi:hypothetical protein
VREVVAEGWGEVQDGWQRTQAQLGNFQAQLRRSSGGTGQAPRPGPPVSAVAGGQKRRVYVEEEEEEYEDSYEASDEVHNFYSMEDDVRSDDNNKMTIEREAGEIDEILNYEDDETPPPRQYERKRAHGSTYSRNNAAKENESDKNKKHHGDKKAPKKVSQRTNAKKEIPKKTWISADLGGDEFGENRNEEEKNFADETVMQESVNNGKESGDKTNNHSTKTTAVEVSTEMANHRVEGVDLREYAKRRRGEPNKIKVETSSVSTVPPPPPPPSTDIATDFFNRLVW